MMKVGNQWLPAFLNSINGTPTYTYMNNQGQWADASGNTYNVEHPLDEVTVKYDPKTNGQVNKAAPDYWRQYGQRRMQQTAGNVDKVIMGTVGAATAPLWLPEIYGAGLVLGGNPDVQQFTNQLLYGLGADTVLKATTGYDYSEAGQRLFSPVLQKIGLSQGMSNIIGQLTGGMMNPGYHIPTMKLNAQKILDPVADYLRNPFPEYSKKLQILNNAFYPTIGTLAGGVAGNQLSKQDVLPEYMRPYAEPVGMLLGGGIGSLLKYAAIPNSYISDMLQYPIIAPYEMARGNYVFGSKAKALLKRTQQESKYFNTVYDNLVDKYINKNAYPGFMDVKPKLEMEIAPKFGEYAAYYDNLKNAVVTPMFKDKNTRIAIPFDIYRKGVISHEATHALHNRANQYSLFGGDGAVTNRGIESNTMVPLSVSIPDSYFELNPVLRYDHVYRTHQNNLKDINVPPEYRHNAADYKQWMSSPEEWHAEYNNIMGRITNGSTVPVSDLTSGQKDIVLNYFMNAFGANKTQSSQALDMIGNYQRNFLQGAKVDVNITKPNAINLMNTITPPPSPSQPAKMMNYDQLRDKFKKLRKYIETLNHMYGKDVKRIGLEYATGQGLERIGDFMMKHTIGMDSDQASHKLLSPIVEPLDITDGQKEGLYRIGSQYVNFGNWFNPSKRLINGYIIDDMYNFARLPYDWFANQK